ncbi:hypothetical protein IOQ59_16495 [Pontibacterium sp. N1Y112]|uniref:Uncharacterized protein n=1 Tax=Pontibacterium sinense TaxID=2781979 RepID=A0A8J7FRV3_9GAMM|nr:hypothetical protein [Pontibacterium sinense]MBE9398862.1 hypothetical protein [Pontibacterium sinense]
MKNLINKLLRRKTETVIDDHVTEIAQDPETVSINPFTGQPVDQQDDHLHQDVDLAETLPDVPEGASRERFNLLKLNTLAGYFSVGPSFAMIAFQAGSFGLRGALIRNSRHYAVPAIVAESRNVDFTRAIAEVMEQLKQHQRRLPKRAILITPSVVSSLVDLPVSPLRPRSDEQMQELIRWELEGAVTQQNKQWLIGSMLVERGYLSPQQRDELVTELQLRQSQGGESAMIRFGDLAVQMKYISYAQLEECFSLQGKLVALDDDLVYGWQAEENLSEQTLSDEVLLSAEEDNNSAHKWLVSGMSKEVRRRWVGAFNLNGLKIEAFYPSVGASFASLSHRCTDQEQWLIELHQEQLACISGHAGGVTEIQVAERLPGAVDAHQINTLTGVLPSDLKNLYINHQELLGDQQLRQLSLELGINVHSLTLDAPDLVTPDGLSDDALLSLSGAADHFLNHVSRARLSWIAARDIEPPIWQKLLQPKTLKLSAAIVVISTLAGFMLWMHANMWQQEQRLAELNEKFEKESAKQKQFGSIISQQSGLKALIADAQLEVGKNTELLSQLSRELPQQQLTVPVLLKAISISIPTGVKLVSVQRTAGQVQIRAEAGGDSQGQEFTHNLNQLLKPMNLQVRSSDVIHDPENLTPLPYTIDIVLQTAVTPLHSSTPPTQSGTRS